MRGPVAGCSIGSYMTMTERRRKIAETILSQGYIEMTPEVIKDYFDFIIYSGRSKDFYDRNGIDYMNPNDVSPSYSVENYLQMMLKNRVIENQTYSILKSDLVDSVYGNDTNKSMK